MWPRPAESQPVHDTCQLPTRLLGWLASGQVGDAHVFPALASSHQPAPTHPTHHMLHVLALISPQPPSHTCCSSSSPSCPTWTRRGGPARWAPQCRWATVCWPWACASPKASVFVKGIRIWNRLHCIHLGIALCEPARAATRPSPGGHQQAGRQPAQGANPNSRVNSLLLKLAGPAPRCCSQQHARHGERH